MKILQLKFKNINSLAGEHKIDFANDKLANSGIFAIVGKTGSGKSTILDAISLALYGRTPRVEISASKNEVITKGEKDSYSEVTFQANNKKYIASWKQSINRNNNLTSPTRGVYEEPERTAIAEGISDCNKKIHEIIGLTFAQFTKVILLAQGSFDAFLKAGKEEKGEILEQITGTSIYGKISKAVFEKHKSHNEKLEQINIQLNSIQLLTNEEIEMIKTENHSIKQQLEEHRKTLDENATIKNGLEKIASTNLDIHNITKELPELEEKMSTTENAEKIAQEAMQKLKTELLQQAPIYTQVRELDININNKTSSKNSIKNQLDDLMKTKNNNETELTYNKNELEKAKKEKDEHEQWINQNETLKTLERDYTAIENEHGYLLEQTDKVKNLDNQLSRIKNDKELKEKALQEAEVKLRNAEKMLYAKNEELESLQASLSQLTQDQDADVLRNNLNSLFELIEKLKKALELKNNQIKINTTLKNGDINLKNNESDQAKLADDYTYVLREKKELEEFIKVLQENINLAKDIENLATYRDLLVQGNECPLCGSKEHPFVTNQPTHNTDNEDMLIEKKRLLALNEEKTTTLQTRQGEIKATIEHTKKTISEKKEELQECQRAFNELSNEIIAMDSGFNLPSEEEITYMQTFLSEKENKKEEINTLLTKSKTLSSSIDSIKENDRPALMLKIDAAKDEKNAAETNLKLAEENNKTKYEERSVANEELKNQTNEFAKKLNIYHAASIEELKKLRDDWDEKQAVIQRLNSKINDLNLNVEKIKTTLESNKNQIEKEEKEHAKITQELNELVGERKNLFGEKLVDEEENTIKKNIETAEKSWAGINKQLQTIRTEHTTKITLLEKWKRELESLKSHISTTKTLEELQEEIEELNEIKEELSQKIGANEEKLKIHNGNVHMNNEKQKEHDDQKEITAKWKKLQDYIGQQDGQKFRNFAQGLTFKELIKHSNEQLKKIMPRYTLIHKPSTNDVFNMVVNDMDNANIERTTENLSGGEKFIVSLTLALGLSTMISENIKIDTIFIDEGFGTLDPQFLNEALGALENLRATGKTIGIISHLDALKEQIAVHIEVQSKGNARSTLKLPY